MADDLATSGVIGKEALRNGKKSDLGIEQGDSNRACSMNSASRRCGALCGSRREGMRRPSSVLLRNQARATGLA
jgi:hypothetical protein